MGSVANYDELPYGRRLLPTLIDQVAVQDPARECYQIPRSAEIEDGWKVITWRDMANAVNRAAHRMVELCGKPEPNTFPTIAYIGPNDVRYLVTMIASIKAGYQALFISTRNSKEGQLSLFENTNCNIIAYADSHAASVQSWLQERDMRAIEVSPLDAWFPTHEVPPFPYTKTFEEAEWDPFAILHTSGSTGLPKPIIVRQGMLAIADAAKTLPLWNGERPACHAWAADAKRMFCPMPMFHMAGIIGGIINCFYEGCPIVLGGPTERPVTADLVTECLLRADVDSTLLPPAIIEDMSQTEEGVRALRKLKTVGFGGGNLARECGNRLIKAGVRIHNLIGATEFAPFQTYTNRNPELWQYFHYNKEVLGCEFRPVEGEADVYEMVMVRQKQNRNHPGLQGIFYTFPDLDEWSTRDLYRPHPTLPDLWMYHGRADNVIVFSNGEKLNPVTMEEIIADHPEVKGTMVVGAQKFQAGLIIEPHVYPTTAQDKKALIDRVWPLIEQANAETVQHGRIARDMVALSNPEKPFLRAGKGTIQRALTVKLYEDDIDKLYENTAGAGEEAPKLNVESEAALAASIVETLQKHLAGAADKLTVDTDFFAAGIDSLGVMNAAKVLRAGLHESLGVPVDAKVLAPRVIYTNSTPARLAAHLFHTVINIKGGSETAAQSEDEQQQEAMRFLHQKYTTDLAQAAPNRPDPRNENQVVLLTGSTGMLGSYLLSLLAANPRVAKIICLNRAADGGRAQQLTALSSRGLDTGVLDTKAEFHHADLSLPTLGLAPAVYARLQAEADRVVHNAWPVNFNIPIESFAPFLAGCRHIADLAATATKRVAVAFISSIATAERWHEQDNKTSETVPETRLEDMALPLGGYGRSKAVGSLIIEDAAAKRVGDFPYAIVRVGQVAGPLAEEGGWNRQEWLPSIIASSLYLGALPEELGSFNRIDWTPAEWIAELVLEAAGVARRVEKAHEINGYYHGVNPHVSEWGVLADAVREFYGGSEGRIRELVGFGEWCDRLERSQLEADGDGHGEESVKRNPGVKLLDSYRGMAAGAGAKTVVYDMEKTAQRCPVVGEMTAVTAEMMKHWCKQWGF